MQLEDEFRACESTEELHACVTRMLELLHSFKGCGIRRAVVSVRKVTELVRTKRAQRQELFTRQVRATLL